MKKLLLLLSVLNVSISSFSQTIRFSDSTNVWQTYLLALQLAPPIIDPYTFNYSGTILYHGNMYKQLYEGGGGGCVGYIREDTIAKKVYGVYLWRIDSITDSEEHVLYDYTLQVGDTFQRPNTVSHYVADMDSVLINSAWYKTWHLVPTIIDTPVGQGNQDDYYVVEGIGSLEFPFFPADPTSFESEYTLTCFSTHDTTPPLSQTVDLYFDNASSCSLNFGLNVKNTSNGTETMYPNPTRTTLTISSIDNITSLAISNLLGQIVYSNYYNSSHINVDVADLPTGIYFLKVNGNEVRKFIKQ